MPERLIRAPRMPLVILSRLPILIRTRHGLRAQRRAQDVDAVLPVRPASVSESRQRVHGNEPEGRGAVTELPGGLSQPRLRLPVRLLCR